MSEEDCENCEVDFDEKDLDETIDLTPEPDEVEVNHEDWDELPDEEDDEELEI